eukprot:gene19327-biopygen20522
MPVQGQLAEKHLSGVLWRITLGITSLSRPDGLTATPDETGYFCGQPWVPATTAFPSGGLFTSSWLKMPSSVLWRIALGIAPFCRPDGLTAAPDATGDTFTCGQPWVPSTTAFPSGGLSMCL